MENKSNPSHKLRNDTKEQGWREYLSLGEVFSYFFRKKDPSRPTNFNIRAMHGINKLSMAIFLVGVIYMIFKHLL